MVDGWCPWGHGRGPLELERAVDVDELATRGSWAPTVARLRCMRGIDTLSAVGLVAEIGDISAFEYSKQLASYLGLVPSEHTREPSAAKTRSPKASSSHTREAGGGSDGADGTEGPFKGTRRQLKYLRASRSSPEPASPGRPAE